MHYALYDNEIPIVDENGFDELETRAGYKNPVLFRAHLTPGKSDAEESPFGKDVSYDRIISTCDMDLPIDENSLIWVSNQPVFNDDGTVNGDSADYEVAAPPLDGLNNLLIAIKRRSRSVGENFTNAKEYEPNSGNGTVEDDGF